MLRGTLGFEGFVVSDANAVRNLLTHGFAADLTDAGARAVNAGVDLEMVISDAAYAHLPEALDSGATDVAAIDASVRRILEARAPRRSAEQDQREQAVTDPVVTAGPRLGVPAARRRWARAFNAPGAPDVVERVAHQSVGACSPASRSRLRDGSGCRAARHPPARHGQRAG